MKEKLIIWVFQHLQWGVSTSNMTQSSGFNCKLLKCTLTGQKHRGNVEEGRDGDEETTTERRQLRMENMCSFIHTPFLPPSTSLHLPLRLPGPDRALIFTYQPEQWGDTKDKVFTGPHSPNRCLWLDKMWIMGMERLLNWAYGQEIKGSTHTVREYLSDRGEEEILAI